jgi:hypothetical protein
MCNEVNFFNNIRQQLLWANSSLIMTLCIASYMLMWTNILCSFASLDLKHVHDYRFIIWYNVFISND